MSKNALIDSNVPVRSSSQGAARAPRAPARDYTAAAPPQALLAKYNVPGPRYTSYPTVPCWDAATFDAGCWREAVRRAAGEAGEGEGVALYVHLPYCETVCTFCGCIKKFTRDHSVEPGYVDAVLAEWALYRELLGEAPVVGQLHLGGGTPTFFSPRQLSRLVGGLLDGVRLADRRELGFEGHPNSTTDGHLQALHELGFRRVSLGVQDLDAQVQAIINRVQPFETVRRVTEAARRIGYESVNFDLIYGLPLQRAAGIARTIERVAELRPERIAFYGYAHVPWKKGIAQRRFRDEDIPRGAAKRALYETGRALLLEAGYCEIGMDHFALPGDALHRAAQEGRVHRNFMGYTPVHTRLGIGLGMSAIGDAWTAFAQNEKDLGAWSARVARGELPVARGHLLDEEDRALRRLILDLMCRFETRLPQAHHPVLAEGLARLDEMVRDRLVAIDGCVVRMTEAGRPFVRNACMAFDARLWRSEPGTRLFSDTV